MFIRTVEVTAKSGKARELTNTINEKVLPILKKQNGFVDETVLVSDTEDNRVRSLSFWNSKEDAERYQREQYPAIHEMIRHLLEVEPVVGLSMLIARPRTGSPPAKPHNEPQCENASQLARISYIPHLIELAAP